MNSEAICDEIEWLIDRNPFADNLPADITVNDLLDKLDEAVTTPKARGKLEDLKGALSAAYKGDGSLAPGGIPFASKEALSLVRSHIRALRDLVSANA